MGIDSAQNVKTTHHLTGVLEGVKNIGKAGALKGISVVQTVAKAPAALSGIGSAVANFFTTKLPAFFSAAKDAIFSLFKRADNAPAAGAAQGEAQPKPLAEYTFPGDWFSNTKNYAVPSKDVQFASVYAGLRYLTDDLDDSGANAFLRSNNSISRIATLLGKPMAAEVRGIVVDIYRDEGVLALREDSYEGHNGYNGLVDGIDAKETARNAAIAAESVFAQIYGHDDDSVAEAASRVPQDLCNALGIAMKAIDDSDASDDIKDKARSKAKTDFIALRTINPAQVTPLPEEAQAEQRLPNVAQRNIIEFSKLAQNIANGVGYGDKEVLHEGAMEYFSEQDTATKLAERFDKFCDQVLARVDEHVVAAAVAGSERLIAEFEGARAG